MPLITRLNNGGPLTIEQMDGNLTYLETIALAGGGTGSGGSGATPSLQDVINVNSFAFKGNFSGTVSSIQIDEGYNSISGGTTIAGGGFVIENGQARIYQNTKPNNYQTSILIDEPSTAIITYHFPDQDENGDYYVATTNLINLQGILNGASNANTDTFVISGNNGVFSMDSNGLIIGNNNSFTLFGSKTFNGSTDFNGYITTGSPVRLLAQSLIEFYDVNSNPTTRNAIIYYTNTGLSIDIQDSKKLTFRSAGTSATSGFFFDAGGWGGISMTQSGIIIDARSNNYGITLQGNAGGVVLDAGGSGLISMTQSGFIIDARSNGTIKMSGSATLNDVQIATVNDLPEATAYSYTTNYVNGQAAGFATEYATYSTTTTFSQIDDIVSLKMPLKFRITSTGQSYVGVSITGPVSCAGTEEYLGTFTATSNTGKTVSGLVRNESGSGNPSTSYVLDVTPPAGYTVNEIFTAVAMLTFVRNI